MALTRQQQKAVFAKLSHIPVSEISIDDPRFKNILRGADFHGLPKNIIQKRIQVSKNTIQEIKEGKKRARRFRGSDTDLSSFDDQLEFETKRLKNAKSALLKQKRISITG